MVSPDYLQAVPGGVCLSLRVQPRSSKNEIGESNGAGELKVKVTAPPVDSAANEAVLRLLTGTLGCARGRVQLLRGNTSRRKQVLIQGMTIEAVTARLGNKG